MPPKKIRKVKPRRSLRTKSQGGFNDLVSFRAETGLTEAEISDNDAIRLITDDMREQVRISQKERDDIKRQQQQLQTQLNNQYDIVLQRDELSRQKSLMANELEKKKREADLYKNLVGTYYGTDPLSAAVDYVQRKRLKEDIKRKLFDEINDDWYRVSNVSKPRSKPRAKSRSKPRTKSRAKSRSKSRSKPRSKPRAKSRSKPRSKPRNKTKK